MTLLADCDVVRLRACWLDTPSLATSVSPERRVLLSEIADSSTTQTYIYNLGFSQTGMSSHQSRSEDAQFDAINTAKLDVSGGKMRLQTPDGEVVGQVNDGDNATAAVAGGMGALTFRLDPVAGESWDSAMLTVSEFGESTSFVTVQLISDVDSVDVRRVTELEVIDDE